MVAQQRRPRALGGVLRLDPRTAGAGAAQPVVQRQSGALQCHPRSRLRELVRAARAWSNTSAGPRCTTRRAHSGKTISTSRSTSSSMCAPKFPQGARVAEFYAGVGAIGLSVLARAGEIRMNEVSPHSLHGLELGLADLDPADRAKVSIVPGPAGAARPAASGAQVVIADPPRKGLDPRADRISGRAAAGALRLRQLRARILPRRRRAADLARQAAARGAHAHSISCPSPSHVETVARFERV